MSLPDDMTATYTYRVAAGDSLEAAEKAKAIARDEGYAIKTLASCRPASTPGQFEVRLVVRPVQPAST